MSHVRSTSRAPLVSRTGSSGSETGCCVPDAVASRASVDIGAIDFTTGEGAASIRSSGRGRFDVGADRRGLPQALGIAAGAASNDGVRRGARAGTAVRSVSTGAMGELSTRGSGSLAVMAFGAGDPGHGATGA